MFILETNTLLERDDETGYLLNQVAFNHSYLGHGSDTSYYHNGDEWEEYNILANDYATSTVRQYINGNNVYKAANTSGSGYTSGSEPDTKSDYSNMYTDFCIDTENDIVYKAITGRTLKDLYLDHGDGPYSEQTVDFPEQLTKLNQEGYTSSTVDKFWLLSYKEAKALLSYTGWPSDKRSNYWLRSPYLAAFYVYGVGYGFVFNYVYRGNYAARAAFTMPL